MWAIKQTTLLAIFYIPNALRSISVTILNVMFSSLKHRIKFLSVNLIWIIIFTLVKTAATENNISKLHVHPLNQRYLRDVNKNAVWLLGYGNEGKNPKEILEKLKGNINYLRAYAAIWNRKDDPNDYYYGLPWLMIDGKADMDRWNEQYWLNLRDYMTNCKELGFIVGLTIWDGHSQLPGGKYGKDSIWSSEYNWQGIQWSYDYESLVKYPMPKKNGNSSERLVYYQRRWLDRLIEEINPFTNVLIEIDNETTKASENWWLWWADYFIKKGNFVIAITYKPKYTISDQTFLKDKRLHMKSYHSRSDSVINQERISWNKIIVADGDNKCENLDAEVARKIAWRSFVKGGHWNDFVCGNKNYPHKLKLTYYGYLLKFVKNKRIPFIEMKPRNDLISEGLLLAKTNYSYLAYLEKNTDINLRNAKGLFKYEWYDPRNGETVYSGEIKGGAVRNFKLPAFFWSSFFTRSNDFVLWIYQ